MSAHWRPLNLSVKVYWITPNYDHSTDIVQHMYLCHIAVPNFFPVLCLVAIMLLSVSVLDLPLTFLIIIVCPEGMVYKECGTSCPPTCDRKRGLLCTLECVQGTPICILLEVYSWILYVHLLVCNNVPGTSLALLYLSPPSLFVSEECHSFIALY